jgi:xanthine dehydrogenase accessory factor
VGLDLGARSPEEQALAICAEIVAVRSGRAAGALKDSRGPING